MEFGWCLLIVLSCVLTTTSAARFEIRNEITKYPGRNRTLAITCWSDTDKLGYHNLKPGESKSWSFDVVYIKIPFVYTYFQCTFFTAFNKPDGQTTTVFEGEGAFRWQCDDPNEEVCIWAVKKGGVFLRKISRNGKGQRLYKDELRVPWIGGRNYYPIKDHP